MARPALATAQDLEDLLGETLTDADSRVYALLALASEIVRAYAGVTWLNTDETDVENVPESIPLVVASMVQRTTSNPSGVVQESAGPFSRSFGPDAAQRLYITRQEKAVIRAAVGLSSVGTIGTTRGDLETLAASTFGGLYDPPTEESDPMSLVDGAS